MDHDLYFHLLLLFFCLPFRSILLSIGEVLASISQKLPTFILQDMDMMNYMVPKTVADLLHEKISGDCEEVLILDVGCGTGKTAKMVKQKSFLRHTVVV